MDVYNAPQLKDALHSLLDEKVADMIIDCKELKYIDSTGLGVLIGVLKRIKDNNVMIVKYNHNKFKTLHRKDF